MPESTVKLSEKFDHVYLFLKWNKKLYKLATDTGRQRQTESIPHHFSTKPFTPLFPTLSIKFPQHFWTLLHYIWLCHTVFAQRHYQVGFLSLVNVSYTNQYMIHWLMYTPLLLVMHQQYTLWLVLHCTFKAIAQCWGSNKQTIKLWNYWISWIMLWKGPQQYVIWL